MVAIVHAARLRRPRRTRAGFRSAVVRRLVTEHQLESGTITGTGTAGRVTRDDVLALAAGTRPDDSDETVALNRIQLQTGANLLRSLQVAPHAFIAMEVDFELT